MIILQLSKRLLFSTFGFSLACYAFRNCSSIRFYTLPLLIFSFSQLTLCGFQGAQLKKGIPSFLPPYIPRALPVGTSSFSGLRRGGDGRIRTGDPLLARQVLYHLSYTPTFSA